jgi:hypothetical protein
MMRALLMLLFITAVAAACKKDQVLADLLWRCADAPVG